MSSLTQTKIKYEDNTLSAVACLGNTNSKLKTLERHAATAAKNHV